MIRLTKPTAGQQFRNMGPQSIHAAVNHASTLSSTASALTRGIPFDKANCYLGYAPTLAIPTNANERIICHAISRNGKDLALGEANGKISIWDMEHYQLLKRLSYSLPAELEKLMFVEGVDNLLIAVTKDESVFELDIIPHGAGAVNENEIAQMRCGQRLDIDVANTDWNLRRCSHDISIDGRTVAVYVWGNQDKLEWIQIHRRNTRTDAKSKVIKIELSNDIDSPVPILSKNGQSFLIYFHQKDSSNDRAATSNKQTKIKIIPKLEFGQNDTTISLDDFTEVIELSGNRAEWGKDGEYVFIWKSDNTKSELSVYETAEFLQDKKPVAKGTYALSPTVQGCEAWVIPAKTNQNNVDPQQLLDHVLLLEYTDMWATWVSVLDLAKDEIVNETNTLFEPITKKPDSSLYSEDLNVRSNEQIPETSQPPTVNPHRFGAEFDFCCSSDGRCIGIFSKKHSRCCIASLESGEVIWTIDFPAVTTSDTRMSIPHKIAFDHSNANFLVFGKKAIFVCAPPSLSYSLYPACRSISEAERCPDGKIERKQGVRRAHRVLSQHALVSVCSRQAKAGNTLLWFDEFPNEDRDTVKIIDAALSTNGDALCLLLEKNNGEAKERSVWLIYDKEAPDVKPRGEDVRREDMRRTLDFEADRVFLYRHHMKRQQRVVAVQTRPEFTLMINLNLEENRVPLPAVKECLCLSMTEKHRQLLILDKKAVHIVDLENVALSTVHYNDIDFSVLLNSINSAVGNSHGSSTPIGFTGRCISDDGENVLLAWDYNNNKSIVVSKNTTQRDCQKQIRKACKKLSKCCVLTSDGESTLFVDVVKLGKRQLSIGCYKECAGVVTKEIFIERVKPALSQSHYDEIFRGIFVGMCCKNQELIVVTMFADQQRMTRTSEDRIRMYTMHGCLNALPSYSLLKSTDHPMWLHFKPHPELACTVPGPNGKTAFQEAVIAENHRLIGIFLKLARQADVQVALEWKEGNETKNLLTWAINSRSTHNISKVVGLLCSDMVSFKTASKLISSNFSQLLKDHQLVLRYLLAGRTLVHKVSGLNVHVCFMDSVRRRDTAVHIHTVQTFQGWAHGSTTTLSKRWSDDHDKTVKTMNKQYRNSNRSTALCFVRIEDAALPGMKGIIRQLLFHAVPEEYFEYEVVKAIVMLKWIKVWRKRYWWRAGVYVIFLVVFSLYAINVSRVAVITDQDNNQFTVESVLLASLWMFGLWMLLQEYRQFTSAIQDGQMYYNSRRSGVYYYCWSVWNQIDVLSSLLLVFVIPTLHILAHTQSGLDRWLSATIALEAVLAYSKIWFFAQPFRSFGTLVRMFHGVVIDCMAFVFLSFAVLCGFGFSLHVLFRDEIGEGGNFSSRNCSEAPTGDDCCGAGVSDAYGTIGQSLLTLFYAMHGEFEPQVYRCAGRLSGLTMLFFVLYMLIQTIILFNLLIAIISNTYDRLKNSSEAQLLIGRARAIDAIESATTEAGLKEIKKEIKKYVCFLDATESRSEIEVLRNMICRMDKKKCVRSLASTESRSEVDVLRNLICGANKATSVCSFDADENRSDVDTEGDWMRFLRRSPSESDLSIGEMTNRSESPLSSVDDNNEFTFQPPHRSPGFHYGDEDRFTDEQSNSARRP